MNLAKSVGRAIRQHRERLGLTQAALAEALGLTVQHVGLIERGVRAPSFGTLEAISRALKTPTRDLFPGVAETREDDENVAAVVGVMTRLDASERARVRRIVEAAANG